MSRNRLGQSATISGTTWIAGAPAVFSKQDYAVVQSFLNPDIGWLIGRSGDLLLRTENGGATWSTVLLGNSLQPYLDQKYIVTQLDMVTPRTGWMVLDRNNLTPAILLKTTNGGQSWSEQTVGYDK